MSESLGEIVFNSFDIFSFQPDPGFQRIALENMPPTSEGIVFSTDAKYLFDMAHAISNGEVSVDLANIRPGKIAHSRWLTKAARLLRLYVTMQNPPRELRILVEFIMKVYVPMYFNIKYHSSVVHGSVLFFNYIRWSQFLEPTLRNIVNRVIIDNAYFAHSENVLLAMLFDKNKEKRDCAIKKILRYRRDVEDPLEVRVYEKPTINFNCTEYTNMIDLNDQNNVFEPPFTRSFAYDELAEYLKDDDLAFVDPKIPMHIQNTEQHVQLVASVVKRVIPENVEGVVATTATSRAKMPRLESKKDLQ